MSRVSAGPDAFKDSLTNLNRKLDDLKTATDQKAEAEVYRLVAGYKADFRKELFAMDRTLVVLWRSGRYEQAEKVSQIYLQMKRDGAAFL